MKFIEVFNQLDKNEVFDRYRRILGNINYESVTKKKMLDDIKSFYLDYNNIISICTERELKYLSKVIINDNDLLDLKYDYIRENLCNKFLIYFDDDNLRIPSDLENEVNMTLKNVDYESVRAVDSINEACVSECFMIGICDYSHFVNDISEYLGIKKNIIELHLRSNKVFNYYVTSSNYSDGSKFLYPYEYFEFLKEINEAQVKFDIDGEIPIDLEKYRYYIYNFFDYDDEMFLNVLKLLKKHSVNVREFLPYIKKAIILNCSREDIVSNLNSCGFTKKEIDIVNAFMNSVPSASLLGMKPNLFNIIKNGFKVKSVKQVNATLSTRETHLFLKIYAGLLEFINRKYKMGFTDIYTNRDNLIYRIVSLKDVINKLWENKDNIVAEFCIGNPFGFDKEELEHARGFSKSIRSAFIFYKHDKDFTEVIYDGKIYMVKSIIHNFDKHFSSKELPKLVNTALIPFAGKIVLDLVYMDSDRMSVIDMDIISNVESMEKYYVIK